MEAYNANILLNFDTIKNILLAQIKNSPDSDVEINATMMKFYFPVESLGKGLFAHSPEDDLTMEDNPWVEDVKEFIKQNCTMNPTFRINCSDLSNVRYTIQVSELLNALENMKG